MAPGAEARSATSGVEVTSHPPLTRSHAQRPGPPMSLEADLADTVHVSPVRKFLLAMLLVSLTGSAFGAGTFASFNASTTNGSSTFSTGTLVLSNTKTSGGTCLSATSGNVTDANDGTGNTACDNLFALTTGK